MIKKRWLVEAFTWKITSMILGFGCVYLLAHDVTMGLAYMALYTPLSTIWYVVHKKLWSNWKRRQYEKTETILGTSEAETEESYDEC